MVIALWKINFDKLCFGIYTHVLGLLGLCSSWNFGTNYENLLQLYVERDSIHEKYYQWVAWNKITLPKYLGGWGLKHPTCFVKELVDKGFWRIIKGEGLWVKVLYHKSSHH